MTPRRKRGRASWDTEAEAAAVPSSVKLGTLEPGTRFMFWADDLQRRGPFLLVEKSPGRAIIRYEGKGETKVRTFTARDAKNQPVQRTITVDSPETQPCSLGAEVIALPD